MLFLLLWYSNILDELHGQATGLNPVGLLVRVYAFLKMAVSASGMPLVTTVRVASFTPSLH